LIIERRIGIDTFIRVELHHIHMSNRTDTIQVPADQYSNHVPTDHKSETIDIGISAYDDTVYIKFPRFDRRGTDDFCVNAESLFRATVGCTDPSGDLNITPVLRRTNVLREKRGEFVHDAPDRVYTKHVGTEWNPAGAHLDLVETVVDTVAGFRDDDFWVGYKRAANTYGDEHYQWSDVCWDCFDREWSGDTDLMLDAGRWMAREGMVVCTRSQAFIPIPEWTTPTGGYVATISDQHDGTCPECGATKDDHWECIESPASIRKPNVYRCQECGTTTRGITTG
jgi:predicted RNA-binding Zn-ribbon protein involved in translation (DUF1610 family)